MKVTPLLLMRSSLVQSTITNALFFLDLSVIKTANGISMAVLFYNSKGVLLMNPIYSLVDKERAHTIIRSSCIDFYKPYDKAILVFDGEETEEQDYQQLVKDWASEADDFFKKSLEDIGKKG